MSQLQGTADSYPQLGSGSIPTCPCRDISAEPGKRLPGYRIPGRAHGGSSCHPDPSPGLTSAPAPAPQRWRSGGAASLSPRGSRASSPCSPGTAGAAPPLPSAPSLPLHPAPLSPPRPLVPVPGPHVPLPGRSRRRRLTCPGAGSRGSCRSCGTCGSCGAGAALRDAAPRAGGPRVPARPGPAHTRQKNAAGPGPRGRGGGTPLYRRKRRPTRAPSRGGMRSAGRHRALRTRGQTCASPPGDTGGERPAGGTAGGRGSP